MKVTIPSELALPKPNKASEVVFRTNRSCDKFSLSLAGKPSLPTPNKEPSVALLINSLHLFLIQEKPLPKIYIRKVIQILSQMESKNNAFEKGKNDDEKTPKKIAQIFKRQPTDDSSHDLSYLESSNKQYSSRIRKVKTKKVLESIATETKQNQVCEPLNVLQKRQIEMEATLERFKKVIQEKQGQLRQKEALISQLQQQKRFIEESNAEALRSKDQSETRLRAEKQQLYEDLLAVTAKQEGLKSLLLQREAQILSYWCVELRQKRQ